MAVAPAPNSATTARIADLHERVSQDEHRLSQIRYQILDLEGHRMSQADVDAAFADFDSVWNGLSSREQAKVMTLLVSRVEFDSADTTIAITFHPTALRTLANERHGARQ